MDFHRNGKEGFKQPFELDLFMSSPEKWSRLGFNLKTIQKLAQEFYEGELKEYIEANENCVVYDKPWATKEKKIRIWDPVNEQYEIIILRTYKVGKKDPTAKRKRYLLLQEPWYPLTASI